MSKQVRAKDGGYAVEAAIREGKIPESRRAHYMAMMAKKPKKTARLLASLEAVLPVADAAMDLSSVREYHEEVAAETGDQYRGLGGPTAYPKEWLGAAGARQPGGIVGEVPSVGHSPITMENPIVAAQCMPGANIPEGLEE